MSKSLLPHDHEAEEALLGVLLIDRTAVASLIPLIEVADFYSIHHQHIFASILYLFERGEPVDPLTVANAMRGQGTLDQIPGGTEKLMSLLNATPSIANARRYANIVIDNSRRRRIITRLSDVIDESFGGGEPDELIAKAGDVAFDRLAGSREIDVDNLYVFRDYLTMADTVDESTPWVLPNMLRAKWRCMLVAEEGAGKFMLFLQLALAAAAGLDPFNPHQTVEPRSVLIVNAENPSGVIRHQTNILNARARMPISQMVGDNLHVWHQEQGIDLLSRRDQARLEKAVLQTKPDLIMLAPLYKVFRPDASRLEADTLRMIQFLDDIRVRYNAALMLEHHVPKGSSMHTRDMMPGGSSLWMRWPELGLVMRALDRNEKAEVIMAELQRFRGDRIPADWPDEIHRGTEMNNVPWVGRWTNGRKPF